MTELTIERLQEMLAKSDGILKPDTLRVRLVSQLLATMQLEAKLREALEEMHALYAGTDRTLDPTEVCGKVQELLYCSEYSEDAQ